MRGFAQELGRRRHCRDRLWRGQDRHRPRFGLAPRGSGEKRIVHIDGTPTRGQAALGERLAVVWLTPSMDRLFSEGPAGRRHFLDRLVLALDPAHAARVAAYEQALRERAQLLREVSADPAWLAALEQVMAEQGVAVAAGRREAVRLLDRVCAEAEDPFPRAVLALVGGVEGWLETMPALAAEADFAAALAAGRRADAAAGGAAIGPHRADLAVTLAETGVPAGLASTGEQKALLISILLAHARICARSAASRRSCCSTKSLPISMPAGVQRCSRRCCGSTARPGLPAPIAALFAPLRCRARFLSVHNGTVAEAAF